MSKNLLITTVTHGDEGFAVPVVAKLAKQYGFDWAKNNLRAYRLGQRLFQRDLNRSAPGDPRSPYYEDRLAYRLVKKYSRYQSVIDIHGSTAKCGVFALVSEPSTQNIELAKKLDVASVVLWPSLRAENGPLTQFIPNSLEIECGPKNSPETAAELSRVLTNFLDGKKSLPDQNFFIVTGLLRGQTSQLMIDFQETDCQGRKFYPLLVDQYPGIKCYTMQKFSETLAVWC